MLLQDLWWKYKAEDLQIDSKDQVLIEDEINNRSYKNESKYKTLQYNQKCILRGIVKLKFLLFINFIYSLE